MTWRFVFRWQHLFTKRQPRARRKKRNPTKQMRLFWWRRQRVAQTIIIIILVVWWQRRTNKNILAEPMTVFMLKWGLCAHNFTAITDWARHICRQLLKPSAASKQRSAQIRIINQALKYIRFDPPPAIIAINPKVCIRNRRGSA